MENFADWFAVKKETQSAHDRNRTKNIYEQLKDDGLGVIWLNRLHGPTERIQLRTAQMGSGEAQLGHYYQGNQESLARGDDMPNWRLET